MDVEDKAIPPADDDSVVVIPGDEASADTDNPSDDTGTGDATGESGDADDESVVVSIGDETITPPDEDIAGAPAWVKEVRKANKEKDRKIRELEAKLAASQPSAPSAEVLPPKPKLDDFDFDPDAYEAAMGKWLDKKLEHDKKVEQDRMRQEAANKAWQDRLAAYETAKRALKVPDHDVAEDVVRAKFSPTQQGIMVQGLDNPALVVYALGKNAKKADELAAITDPVRFAVAVAKLETQLKVTPRKAPPVPPRVAAGAAPLSGTVDSTLERLRAEAEKTGDYTKVTQYKKSKAARD